MAFLSVLIPCWNCSETIGRLLDSIVANVDKGFEKDELKVIIVDDKSTDNFLDIVKTYEDKLNIVYTETTRDFHCPGNTRQAGLKLIDTEWFTFIDNDDMFEPYAFTLVREWIRSNPQIQYTLVTGFREYYPQENTFGRIFLRDECDTWLHGKYFNTQNTLKVFNCHFRDDQFSHEDVYFNSLNLGNLISIGKDYEYYDVFTYRWVDNPKSLSRSYFEKDYFYIEKYLGDYILGASDPFFDLFKKPGVDKGFCFNQILMALLHAYFYHQASIWRIGDKTLPENFEYIRTLKNRINTELGVDDNGILNYIYSIPERYTKIRNSCTYGSCAFIEVQSFSDFIFSLSKEDK